MALRIASRWSHFGKKLAARALERESANIRSTCCFKTAGSMSWLRAATSSSSSSGMLLQRKKESREASSRSLRRYGVLGGVSGGSRSMRNRNSGSTSSRSIPAWIPVSKSPSARTVS